MADIMDELKTYDEAYENASAEGAKADLAPGQYVLRVKDGEVFKSKDGRIYLKLNLQVSEGESTGLTVSKLYALDAPEKLGWLKKDMFTMGVMVQKLSQLHEQITKIIGLALVVEVKLNGKYTNYYINGRAAPKATDDDGVPF